MPETQCARTAGTGKTSVGIKETENYEVTHMWCNVLILYCTHYSNVTMHNYTNTHIICIPVLFLAVVCGTCVCTHIKHIYNTVTCCYCTPCM